MLSCQQDDSHCDKLVKAHGRTGGRDLSERCVLGKVYQQRHNM